MTWFNNLCYMQRREKHQHYCFRGRITMLHEQRLNSLLHQKIHNIGSLDKFSDMFNCTCGRTRRRGNNACRMHASYTRHVEPRYTRLGHAAFQNAACIHHGKSANICITNSSLSIFDNLGDWSSDESGRSLELHDSNPVVIPRIHIVDDSG